MENGRLLRNSLDHANPLWWVSVQYLRWNREWIFPLSFRKLGIVVTSYSFTYRNGICKVDETDALRNHSALSFNSLFSCHNRHTMALIIFKITQPNRMTTDLLPWSNVRMKNLFRNLLSKQSDKGCILAIITMIPWSEKRHTIPSVATCKTCDFIEEMLVASQVNDFWFKIYSHD